MKIKVEKAHDDNYVAYVHSGEFHFWKDGSTKADAVKALRADLKRYIKSFSERRELAVSEVLKLWDAQGNFLARAKKDLEL